MPPGIFNGPKSFYESEAAALADKEYLKACQLDGNSETLDLAEKHLRKCLELNPKHAEAANNLGNIYLGRGDLKRSEIFYRKALRAEPGSVTAHYNYAYLCHEIGKNKCAIKHYLKAITLDPNFEDAYFNLAKLYCKQGESPKAWPHWQRYLLLDPNSHWSSIARRYLSMV